MISLEARMIGIHFSVGICYSPPASQGQVADAVFYIQQGKVKLTVVSEQGKEAVVANPGTRPLFR
jgi:CRP-like cAMP-binding protein